MKLKIQYDIVNVTSESIINESYIKEAVNCPNPKAVDSAKMELSEPDCKLQSCSPVNVLKHLLFRYLLFCHLRYCHLTIVYASQVVVQSFSQNLSLKRP